MTVEEKTKFTKRKNAALKDLPKRGFVKILVSLNPQIKAMDVYDVTANKSYNLKVLEALESLAKKLKPKINPN